MSDSESLQEEIVSLRKRNRVLEELLKEAGVTSKSPPEEENEEPIGNGLTNAEIYRYGRQILVPEISVEGQVALRNSSVVVVGAGGLGSPVLLYLAGAGVGCIGIVDCDTVSLNNLHRQIIHEESSIGLPKVVSASAAIKGIASKCKVVTHNNQLGPVNAMEILHQYDIIIDASDNVATKYLLNDSAVVLGKPLVSASVLRAQGQLTVLNFKSGPCYRCIFPEPSPEGTVANCSDGGVLNVIPGILGSIQALEAIKLCAYKETSYSGKMLTFDGINGEFKTYKIRNRNPECQICGDNKITSLQCVENFCGSDYSDKFVPKSVVDSNDRITCEEYNKILSKKLPHVLVDAREYVEYKICHLENSLNIQPWALRRRLGEIHEAVSNLSKKEDVCEDDVPIYFICRRGNSSQVALEIFRKIQNEDNGKLSKNVAKDISGGLQAWSQTVDHSFPIY